MITKGTTDETGAIPSEREPVGEIRDEADVLPAQFSKLIYQD